MSQHSGISKRARQLLSSGESQFVDYKERVKGLHSEDLVAFANSINGGAILIGVRERTGVGGVQAGEPIGHPVDDESRLQILSKALSCSPPVRIEVVVENLASKPFYRIEIPSGTMKPYATSSGTYKIREDGRNNSLLPEQLLKIFLEREGEEFSRRFLDATSRLEKQMAGALGNVDGLEKVISSKIEEIGDDLGWAQYKAGDAADTIDTVKGLVDWLIRESGDQTQRLRAIIKKTRAEDPVKKKAEEEVRSHIREKLRAAPELLQAAREGGELTLSLTGDAASELDEEDLRRLLLEAVKSLDDGRAPTLEGGSSGQPRQHDPGDGSVTI